MKVLILNGSPRANGNTGIAVKELVRTFEAEGVEAIVYQLGNKADANAAVYGQRG